ncbi:MAG TPA: TolC family protein [Spirochaetota bacterium]|nr:TolC family protein [Spirochaetota bacterium]
MKILITIALFTLSFFCYSEELVTAKENINLSLKQAVELGLKNNLSLNKEKLNFKDREIELYTIFNKFYPDLNLSSSLNIKPESSGISFSLSSGHSFNTKMIFEIIDTNINYKIGKISFDQARTLLIKNIKKMYFKLVLQKKEISIKEKLLENTKNRFNKATIQFNQGEISELDKLNEELSYKTLLPEITKLKNDLQNNLNQFCFLIGLDFNNDIILTNEIPKLRNSNIPDKNKLNSDNNFDIDTLKLKITKEENSKNILISSLTPTIRLSYSLSLSSLKDIFKNNWGSEIEKEWSNNQNFSLSLSFPLHSTFPFSTNQVEILKKDTSIKRAKIDLTNEIKKKEVEFLNLVLNLKQIDQTFDILDFNLKLSDKILKLTERSFNEGVKNLLDVKDAEKNLLDANLKLEKAYFDYYDNYIELEYLIGLSKNQDL